jgi:hypothetical protein
MVHLAEYAGGRKSTGAKQAAEKGLFGEATLSG